MAYFLGIDAGATKTNCVLGTESNVLARAQGARLIFLQPDVTVSHRFRQVPNRVEREDN